MLNRLNISDEAVIAESARDCRRQFIRELGAGSGWAVASLACPTSGSRARSVELAGSSAGGAGSMGGGAEGAPTPRFGGLRDRRVAQRPP